MEYALHFPSIAPTHPLSWPGCPSRHPAKNDREPLSWLKCGDQYGDAVQAQHRARKVEALRVKNRRAESRARAHMMERNRSSESSSSESVIVVVCKRRALLPIGPRAGIMVSGVHRASGLGPAPAFVRTVATYETTRTLSAMAREAS